jgi:CheY-like chemotaxis protein
MALMKKQGLDYDCAADGRIALNKYMEDPARYFLILMDMNMPVMDGFESTAKIRAFERKNNLPAANIAALTGVTSEESRTSAYDAGVNRYLTKPIQMKDLTKLVSETRENKQDGDE